MSVLATPPASVPPPAPSAPPVQLEPIPKVYRGSRVFIFYSLAVGLTGFASLLFADLLWRQGWSTSRTILLVLFAILFLLASIGCMHAIYGFIIRRVGDRRKITSMGDFRSRSLAGTSTALVFPVYNENVRRVCEGLRTVYDSLAATGELERFDFFILSDSTNPDHWVEEERRWFDLVKNLRALGRIYYRRRLINENKKSGNIRDFLSHWGQRYRYIIVMDADSIMAGTTVVDLVKLMEHHPTAGLIQTAPALVNARSAFGRMQQFANRFYGAIFVAGLNYWSQDGGNYWGHNAIIRTEPFMRYCDLPHLPGRKPFGGHILSHDFVEAALLRKENWEVWLAWDLEGTYEEGPPAMIDNAQRDRRWCQGNLQHAMLLFARGLKGINRIHLSMGILGYLAGPLWFAFMLTGTYVLWFRKQTGLSDIVVAAFTPFIRMEARYHALLIFGLAMTVIFLPKILSLIDLALDRQRRKAFGGWHHAAASVFVETLFSSLHAPIQMLFHTKFVFATLLGMGVHWSTQNRAADGTAWGTAIREHWGHTATGVVWGAAVWYLAPAAFWWFSPVLIGLLVSIPLSVWTSRESLGQAARRAGLFLTPEETSPPPEIQRLHQALEQPDSAGSSVSLPQSQGLAEAVLDPYLNAIHISLLRERHASPGLTEASLPKPKPEENRALAEKLLKVGPDALTTAEQLTLLADADMLSWLHRQVWMRSQELAEYWTSAVRRYAE